MLRSSDRSSARTETVSADRSRVDWVDFAKGLSILLVVLYHVWNGIMMRPDRISSPSEWYDPINRAFELVRMPLFFFVSGLFVARSVQKGSWRFIQDKLGGIVWPYLIWSCIHVFITVGLSRLGGQKSDLMIRHLPYYLAVDPVAQFWFLYVLFMSLMLYLVLDRLGTNRWVILVIGVGLLLVKLNVDFKPVGVSLGGYEISLAGWGPFYQLMNFFIYMALGVVTGPWLLGYWARVSNIVLMLLMLVSVIGIVGFIKMGDPHLVRRDAAIQWYGFWFPIGIVLAMLSVAGALSAAELMNRAMGFGFVRQMGKFSLYIFVMHVICAAGVRTLLLKMDVKDFAVHLSFGLLAGILIPIGVAIVTRKTGLTYLFTWRERSNDKRAN